MRPGLIDTQIIGSRDNGITRSAKARRHKLRAAAASILIGKRNEGRPHRVCTCGRRRAEVVTVVKNNHGTCDYTGIETCGSIWACAVCSSKIAVHRAQEVAALITAHEAAGGVTYMLTLTLQHHRRQPLGELRTGIADVWTKFRRSAPFKFARANCGQKHYVKAFEITHGQHGWHPHFHVLLLLEHELSSEEEGDLRAQLFEGWQRAADRCNFFVADGALDLRKATSADAASDYVAKWGTAAEITKGFDKAARGGSRTPWQILADAKRGCWRSKRLFREYAREVHGCRHLTYSRGARDAYDLEAAADDAAIADAPELALDADVTEVYRFDQGTWSAVCKANIQGEVLVAAERGGQKGVHDLLCEEGISPSYMKPPDRRWFKKPPCRTGWQPGEQQDTKEFFKWIRDAKQSPTLQRRRHSREWALVMAATAQGLMPYIPGQSVPEAKAMARDLERRGLLSLDTLTATKRSSAC